MLLSLIIKPLRLSPKNRDRQGTSPKNRGGVALRAISSKTILSQLTIILFFILGSYSIVYSQTVDYSTPEDVNSKAPFTTVLAQNSNGLYVLHQNYHQRRRNIVIEKYAGDLKAHISKEFLTRKDQFLLQIIIRENELEIFYCERNKSTKNIDILIKKTDPELNSLRNDSLLLSVTDQDPEQDYIQVIKSRNYSNTLILAPRIKAEVPTEYTYMVIDSALNIKTKGEFDMDVTNPYTLDQVAYTDKDIAVLLRTDVPKKVFRDGYRYSIAFGGLGQNLLKTYSLFNDSFNVSEGILKTDHINKKFVFAGLYYLKDSNYSKGYYLWSGGLDSTRIIMSIAKPFTPDVLHDVTGSYSPKNGIPSIRLGDMVLRRDGGIVLIAEEYKASRELQSDMNFYGGLPMNNFRYFFYYDNIIVISLDKEGKKDWYHILKKEQVSINDNGVYSSYLLHAMDDKLVFVFNDLSRKRWLLSSFNLNSKGQDETRVLIHPQEYIGKILPRDGGQVSNTEFVIPGFTERGAVVVRVRL